MIRVVAAAEPNNFNRTVRVPGTALLRTTPNPNNHQWRGCDYWRRATSDLFVAYNGICAYCASWTMRAQQNERPEDSTVDHFIPKCDEPRQAYEWNNYRLSRRRLNIRKGNHRDVIDPFILTPGWFKLNFLTFLIMPDSALSVSDKARVTATIERLQLNTDNDYVNERIGAIRQYCLEKVDFAQLSKLYPFIASEMIDQNFDATFLPMMRNRFMQLAR